MLRPTQRGLWRLVALSVFVAIASLATLAHATRIEELTNVRGVRPNQLTGYGLVVGLNGSGDSGQARFTLQSTAGMLRRLGANIDPAQIQTKNAAAVIVTATLPPFAHPGTRLDVTVSSLGNARSLLGGTLVQTPLYGADRNVYAVSQGPLVIGGFSAGGGSGSSVSLNHVTVGRVPEGAIVERSAPTPGLDRDELVFSLRDPSFTTARRIALAINEHLGGDVALAPNPATVTLAVPDAYRRDQVGLIAELQALQVDPGIPVRVVIDERTGTVVLGAGVTISEVAIAQGGLTVEISESFAVSQPEALAGGDTAGGAGNRGAGFGAPRRVGTPASTSESGPTSSQPSTPLVLPHATSSPSSKRCVRRARCKPIWRSSESSAELRGGRGRSRPACPRRIRRAAPSAGGRGRTPV